MRKSIKKMLFLGLLIALALAIVSCMPEKKDEETEPDETNQNAIETLDPNEALSVNGYVIVRADLAKKDVKDAAATLRSSINEKTGTDILIVTDMKGKADKEILVGPSKRASADGISLDQFKITRTGNTIAIIGGTDAQTVKGVEFFIENLVSESGLLIADGYSYIPASEFTVTAIKVGGKDVFSLYVGNDVDNPAIATNLAALIAQKVGLPSEQTKKLSKANIIVTDDISIAGVKAGEWAVCTKDEKIYLVGQTYYEQKEAYDYLSDLIRTTKGELSLADGVIQSAKIQTKEEFYNQTQLVIYPELPDQVRRNYDYKVTVSQGDKKADIPVYNHTMVYNDYSRCVGGDYYRRYSMFAFSGERTRVDITVGRDFSYYTVMPSAKNFETTFENGVISVYLDKPDYFMIRLDEDDSSIISVAADYPEYPGDIPTKGDPGVYYIEGWYEPESGLFEMTEAGDHLYIAPGAVLNARCRVTGNGSRITGRGVVIDPFANIYERDIREGGTEGSGWKMMAITGDDSYFDGITFMDARCFNLAISADRCQIYNYKALSSMMTTDGLSLFGGHSNYAEHMLLYVADNVFVYSVTSGHVKDALCGTTCAILFPQGDTKDVIFEELYVVRASDGFINNTYNPAGKDRSHGSTLINCDAVDCINLPHFFRGRHMGKLAKSFVFQNISLPKLTSKNNPHGAVAGFPDKYASRLFYVDNSEQYLYTENYNMTLTNVYVNGTLIEYADQLTVLPPIFNLSIENDSSYKPVNRITHSCDYVAKNTVHIGTLQVFFEHDVIKEGNGFLLPAEEIFKHLRTDESFTTKDVDGVAYVSTDDLKKCSAVDSISVNNRGVNITPKDPKGNILLPDEGEISYFSEAASYTVDMVVVEEDGETVYYMYDHGEYFTAGVSRALTNDIRMYGAGTYTLSFAAKAPETAEITVTARYDSEPSLAVLVAESFEIEQRWTDVNISFEITQEMIDNNTGFYFISSLTKTLGEHEWYAAKNFALTK